MQVWLILKIKDRWKSIEICLTASDLKQYTAKLWHKAFSISYIHCINIIILSCCQKKLQAVFDTPQQPAASIDLCCKQTDSREQVLQINKMRNWWIDKSVSSAVCNCTLLFIHLIGAKQLLHHHLPCLAATDLHVLLLCKGLTCVFLNKFLLSISQV